jgi:hypothetical protein
MMAGIERMLLKLEGCSMQIFIKTPSGKTITLDVKESDAVDKMKALIFDSRSTITFAGKHLRTGQTLSDYKIQSESTLFEAEKVLGGVMKGHLKKDEVLTGLRQRIERKLLEQCDVKSQTKKVVPNAVMEIVESVADAIKEAKDTHDQSGTAVEVALGKLTIHQLDEVLQLLVETQSGTHQDKKLTALAYAIMPDLGEVDDMIDSLNRIKIQAISTFIEIILKECPYAKSGNGASLSTDTLKGLVNAEKAFRKKLRTLSKEEQQQIEPPKAQKRGCVVS